MKCEGENCIAEVVPKPGPCLCPNCEAKLSRKMLSGFGRAINKRIWKRSGFDPAKPGEDRTEVGIYKPKL
jgi:hypothetical protein